MKTKQTVISVLIAFLLFSCTTQQQSLAKMQSDNGTPDFDELVTYGPYKINQ